MGGIWRVRWAVGPAVALVLVVGGLAGCSSGSRSGGPGTTSDPNAVRVAIVSDSEVPGPVADGLNRTTGIRVVSADLHPGYVIAQLDPALDRAIAEKPDVIVYSAGANDLRNGPNGIVEALKARMTKAQRTACVVAVIPTTDPDQITPAQRALLVSLLGVLTGAVKSWGVRTVSYFDLAAGMKRAGQHFFAGTGLGSFHPGPAAHPVIVAALAQAVNGCPRRPRA